MNLGNLIYKSRKSGHSTTNKLVRAYIYVKYKGICNICKRQHNKKLANTRPYKYFSAFEIDHIVPYSRGGRNHVDNYQLLCKDCNKKKSNKTDD